MSSTVEASLVLRARDLTKGPLKSFRTSINDTGRVVGRLTGIVAGLVGPAAFGAMVKSSFEVVDSQQKLADRLGMTQEALAGLTLAAETTAGVSERTLGMAMQRLTRRTAEAAKGMGEAQGAIADLGLDARELAKLTPDQQFRAIAGAMQEVKDQGEAVRIAFKLFDSEGAALVQTLRAGPEALDAFTDRARSLGTALTRVETGQIEAANDALTEARGVMRGVGNVAAVELAPFVKAVADEFTAAAVSSGGFRSEVTNAAESAAKGIAFVGDVVQGVKVSFKGLTLIGQGFGAAIVNSFALAATGIAETIDYINGLTNSAIEGLNRIPGVDIDQLAPVAASDLMQMIQGVAEEARKDLAETRSELHDLAMQPLPSDGIEAWFVEIRKRAEEAAAGIETVQQSVVGPGSLLAEIDVSKLPKLRETEDKSNDVADQARGLADLVARTLGEGTSKGVDGMVDSFAKGLERMAQELISSQIQQMLMSSFGLGGTSAAAGAGAGGGGGFAGAFRSLLGFSSGGSMRVPGSGGVDSVVPLFRATPGEPIALGQDAIDGIGGGRRGGTEIQIIDQRGAGAPAVRQERATFQDREFVRLVIEPEVASFLGSNRSEGARRAGGMSTRRRGMR